MKFINILKSYLAIFALLFSCCNLAVAEDSKIVLNNQGDQIEIILETKPESKVYYVFSYLFGTVGSVLVCKGDHCSSMIGKIFTIFNSGIIILASVMMSYIVILSSYSEGLSSQMMQQKFASPWIPLRAVFGLGFVLPTASGYSVLQILLIKIILIGSSVGDSIWRNVAEYKVATGSSISKEQQLFNNQSVNDAYDANSYNISHHLAELAGYVGYLNTPEGRASSKLSSAIPMEVPFQIYLEKNTFKCGIPGNQPEYQDYKQICGSLQFEGTTDPEFIEYIQILGNSIQIYAESITSEMAGNNNKYAGDEKVDKENFKVLTANLSTTLLNAAKTKKINEYSSREENINEMLNSEWIMIPKYFYQMIKPSNSATLPTLSIQYEYTQAVPQDLDQNGKIWSLVTYTFDKENGLYNFLLDNSNDSEFDKNFPRIKFRDSGVSNEVNLVFKSAFSPSNQDDALVTLNKIGVSCLKSAYQLMTTVFALSITFVAISSILSDFISATLYGAIVSAFLFLIGFIQVFFFLIPVGTILGIYLPMVPLVAFTSAILMWITQSIYTLVSGPIIALGLISAGEGLGKAEAAFLLVTNIFMRPALIILGLIAGSKLFNIFFYLSIDGLRATIEASSKIFNTGGLDTIFGFVFYYLFTFMSSALCTRCYSLISIIPDRVLTWIGAPALPSNEITKSLQSAEKSISESNQKVETMVKSSSGAASELLGEMQTMGEGDSKKKLSQEKQRSIMSMFKLNW